MSLRIQNTSPTHLEALASEKVIEVVVLYTSVELAEAALKRAEELAHGMELRVRLVYAQIVPYPLPVDKPPINLDHLQHELALVSEHSGLAVEGEIVLARDIQTALQTTLKPHSIVVLASRRRLWRTKEESLKKECVKAGHEVVLCYAR
jgi:hypothetical protein